MQGAVLTARRGHKGVERRRQAILAAARAMLNREPLAMRRLADAAGVSPATPYNLFGTKRRLFVALYEQQRAELIDRLAASDPPDAFARMFHAIHLFGAELAAEPAFFRALFATLYASDPDEPTPPGSDPGAAFWRAIVADLHKEGLIRATVSVDAFAANFVYLIGGATLDWVEGRIDVDRWETAVAYGLALSALTVATDTARADLQTRLAVLEARIAIA
ncbi:transcriptional regulator, TetR family [Sphingomonas laterariae]|uniref:Transcriptional regulator, TetR family n=2 Tax=Edaphosphingomonas laterariae TaxID=861865 RepID=A0A239BLW4_9SPHN|nr:transcriptional regulator, TetR family [Sphingomonas laterariae]